MAGEIGGMIRGDAQSLPWRTGSVQTIVTSPPYWGQRDYGVDGQIGMEPVYTEYLGVMRRAGEEMLRVLRPDGVLWLNLGDTFNTRAIIRPSSHQGGLGHDTESTRLSWAQARDMGLVRYSARQPGMVDKDLMMLPWRVALDFQALGFIFRCDIVWSKPYGVPENAPDRPSRTHEYVFMFSKETKYKFHKDEAPRSVWEIAPSRGGGDHGAVFPEELVERCVMASTDAGDIVADPFCGSGTTVHVANRLGRIGSGVDLKPVSGRSTR